MAAKRRSRSPSPAPLTPQIIKWFKANARDMPWRRTLDPYGIWVSEIMLQQTQVKTVIPYWNRWMKRLPTINSLAHAKEETVLKLWEGLGYYSRARNIHKAAKQIVSEYAGKFPTDAEAVSKLAGIGRYTTGAISSIAFDQPTPILDGNVIRVLTRTFGIAGDPKSKEVNGRLWHLAEELVGHAKSDASVIRSGPLVFAGERSLVNQGLMELGATVCLPTNPACQDCPVQQSCIAHVEDRIEQLPEIKRRQKTTQRTFVTIVLRRGEKVLVRKRPTGTVNAEFWEFPNQETTSTKLKAADVCRELFGLETRPVEIDRFKHSITRYRFEQIVYQIQAPPNFKFSGGQWIHAKLPRNKPFYSPQIRIFEKLTKKALPEMGGL